MNENPNFEQNYCSRTAKGMCRLGHDSIRLMRWMAYYDRYYENISYFDLVASVLTCLIEIS